MNVADLEQLEKLTRLRDAGALTEEEFQEQKRMLLASPPSVPAGRQTWPIAAGAVVTLLVLVGLVYLFTHQTSSDIAAATRNMQLASGSDNATSEAQPTAMPEPSSAPVQQFGYAWATSPDILGTNPAFIESKLGPAERKNADYLSYKVAGCDIDYHIKAQKVDRVTTMVSKGCHPIFEGNPLTEGTTFAALASMGSKLDDLKASCIGGLCGNAADPTIDLVQPGYHANQFVDYVLQGSAGSPTGEAMDAWQAAIRVSHGLAANDYNNDDPDWFQCVANPPASVKKLMAPEHINSVTFGYGLTDDCLNY